MGEISVLLPVAFPDEDYCSSLHQSTGGDMHGNNSLIFSKWDITVFIETRSINLVSAYRLAEANGTSSHWLYSLLTLFIAIRNKISSIGVLPGKRAWWIGLLSRKNVEHPS